MAKTRQDFPKHILICFGNAICVQNVQCNMSYHQLMSNLEVQTHTIKLCYFNVYVRKIYCQLQHLTKLETYKLTLIVRCIESVCYTKPSLCMMDVKVPRTKIKRLLRNCRISLKLDAVIIPINFILHYKLFLTLSATLIDKMVNNT